MRVSLLSRDAAITSFDQVRYLVAILFLKTIPRLDNSDLDYERNAQFFKSISYIGLISGIKTWSQDYAMPCHFHSVVDNNL